MGFPNFRFDNWQNPQEAARDSGVSPESGFLLGGVVPAFFLEQEQSKGRDEASATAAWNAKSAQEKKNLAEGLNADGSPIGPEWESIRNPDGSLQNQYKLDPTQQEGYNMQRALAKADLGTSDFAKQAQAKNIFDRQDQIESAGAQATSGTRAAINQLATRGGVGGGARERMAAGGAQNLMAAKQGAYRASAGRSMNITSQEEQMRRGALDKFGAQESGAAQYNMNNILRDQSGKQAHNMDKYKLGLDKWGAGVQAQATRDSGGGGK